MASTNLINPMYVPTPADNTNTAGTNSTGQSGSSSDPNELTGDSFITLLTAQLQAQDPLNPIDPTTFVTQLVQFNQLQQLIDINSALTPPATTPAASDVSKGASSNSSAGVPQN